MLGKLKNLRLQGLFLSKWFFYGLVLTLPLQTRKIFFTEISFYADYHAFYNSLYFYLTDLLFLGLILFWLIEKYSSQEGHTGSTKNTPTFHRLYTPLFIFWLILAISRIGSSEISLFYFGLAKFTQFFLLFAYIREKVEFSREKQTIFSLFIVSAVFQSIFGIFQYISQKSLDLRFLGEEYLRPGLSGIAEFFSRETWRFGSQISDFVINIRAYGTFPHPNVLAGFLFVAFLMNLYLLYKIEFSHEKYIKWLILAISMVIISTGLTLTFSRLAWAVTVISIIVWIWLILAKIGKKEIFHMKAGRLNLKHKKFSPKNLLLILLVLIISFGLNWYLFGRPIEDRLKNIQYPISNIQDTEVSDFVSNESFSQRRLFNEIAWAMIKDNPLIGVGVRNYVAAMDQYSDLADEEFKVQGRLKPFIHQPVHNIYLLIAAEAGALALVSFLVLIFTIILRRIRVHRLEIIDYTLLIIVIGLLFIGLFDHYLLTIQQGGLLFWAVLGLLAVRAK